MRVEKVKLLKWLIVLIFIVSLAMLPIGINHFSKPLTTSETPKESVFKTLESHETIEVVETTESDKFNKINDVLKDARLDGATTAISIRNASDGELVYSKLGDTRVKPASIMKLLTGATALETIGPAHKFKTEVYADGPIKDGVLQGNLYLRGQGDPTLTAPDLTAFAAELKKKGILSITGAIYGDDTWYDDVRFSQDLNWSDEPYYTGAPISALTLSPNEDYDAGTVIVEVYPAAKKGEAGTIRMVPANSYIDITNKTQTVAKKGANNIKVERLHGSNTIVVSGTIPLGLAKNRSWASVWEPTDYTVNVLKHMLIGQGIKFGDTPEISRAVVPKGATLLASKQSMPLEELFIPFMKLSNNGHGEVLVKEMGRVIENEGSWDEGLAVMDGYLAEMGMDTSTMQLRDGSGMSHKTLVTANEVTKLLNNVQTKPWYPVFLNSLPVAGNDERLVGGTLRGRMTGTAAEGKVKAKTGTLNGVASLSGYVETKDGETLIFSVIINNQLDEKTYEVLDQIAVILANHKEG